MVGVGGMGMEVDWEACIRWTCVMANCMGEWMAAAVGEAARSCHWAVDLAAQCMYKRPTTYKAPMRMPSTLRSAWVHSRGNQQYVWCVLLGALQQTWLVIVVAW
jgi:hypothetical protein